MAASTTELPLARPASAGGYKTIAAVVALNAALVALWSSGLAPQLAAENGILETLQLLFAAGAIGVFTFAALEDNGPVGTSGAALAALVTIALLREIDVRRLVVPDWMMVWAESVYRDAILVVMLLLVFGYALCRLKHAGAWLRLLLRWRAWPVWLSGASFAASVVVERGAFFASDIGLMVEEMAELNGFVLLVLAAWSHCRLLLSADPKA